MNVPGTIAGPLVNRENMDKTSDEFAYIWIATV
jgi:hypothetical protein